MAYLNDLTKSKGCTRVQCPHCGRWYVFKSNLLKTNLRVLETERRGVIFGTKSRGWVLCPSGHWFNVFKVWGQAGGRRPKQYSPEERERRRKLLKKVRSRRWKVVL